MRYASGDSLYPNPYGPLKGPDPIMAIFSKEDIKDAAKPELHPEGLHRAKLVTAEAKVSKKGKQMIKATFRTNHGRVSTHYVWSPESSVAKRIFIQDMTKLGIGDLSIYDDFQTLADDLLKAEVLISVAHEEYEGNTFATVKKIDALPSEPVADDEDGPEAPPPPSDDDAPVDETF